MGWGLWSEDCDFSESIYDSPDRCADFEKIKLIVLDSAPVVWKEHIPKKKLIYRHLNRCFYRMYRTDVVVPFGLGLSYILRP